MPGTWAVSDGVANLPLDVAAATTREQRDADDRYEPSRTHPGEWVCRDCSPPTGQRITRRDGHDTWHALAPESA